MTLVLLYLKDSFKLSTKGGACLFGQRMKLKIRMTLMKFICFSWGPCLSFNQWQFIKLDQQTVLQDNVGFSLFCGVVS